MNALTPMHFTHQSLLQPTNPVTLNLIGAGGTGSQMLTNLARMNHAMTTLGHAGLDVCLWDSDRITEANLGRQLFASSELGQYKSAALIARVNRFFGTAWKARPEKFCRDTIDGCPANAAASIYVSCVDTAASRFEIASILRQLDYAGFGRDKGLYWMDCGNAAHTGQVLLSTISLIPQPVSNRFETVAKLPMITDEYKSLLAAVKEDELPSCSLAEALDKQDLFINSTIATLGSALLWKLFRTGMTDCRGFFVDLQSFRSVPIPLPPAPALMKNPVPSAA